MGNKEEEGCLQLNQDLLRDYPSGFSDMSQHWQINFCDFRVSPDALQGSPRQRDDVTSAITPSSRSTQQRGWKDSWLNLPFLNGPLSPSSLEAPAAETSDKPHLRLLPFTQLVRSIRNHVQSGQILMIYVEFYLNSYSVSILPERLLQIIRKYSISRLTQNNNNEKQNKQINRTSFLDLCWFSR